MSDAKFDGALWFKANGSGEGGCVEVAITPSVIGVRDTKDKGSGPIPKSWSWNARISKRAPSAFSASARSAWILS